MSTRIKICGITRLEDALAAVEYGADVLGFVFSKSPRQVTPEQAEAIIQQLPPFVFSVGVFANETQDRIFDVLDSCPLEILQLHGDESPRFCSEIKEENKKVIKAIRVRDELSLLELDRYDVDGLLLDTYSNKAFGGTGKSFDWSLLENIQIKKPLILSGGLNSNNVGEAIQKLSPYGVDASSSLESSPGEKGKEKIKQFIEAIKKADRS